MVLAKTPKPVIVSKPTPANPQINHRHKPLTEFVTEDEYRQIKTATLDLKVDHGITLRMIWAVVDHLVAVCDGRESEVQYATDTKAPATQTPSPRPRPSVPKGSLR